MIYAVHCSQDDKLLIVEELKKFKTEEEFDRYNEYCQVYDDGASHYLKRLDVMDYCRLQDAGRNAITKAFRTMRL